MTPRERLWQTVAWGTALIAGVALLVSVDILPVWSIPFTGDIFVNRVVSASLVAMFAVVVGPKVAKGVGKIFEEILL